MGGAERKEFVNLNTYLCCQSIFADGSSQGVCILGMGQRMTPFVWRVNHVPLLTSFKCLLMYAFKVCTLEKYWCFYVLNPMTVWKYFFSFLLYQRVHG